jgi:ligand-binding sensor domain-containing protein
LTNTTEQQMTKYYLHKPIYSLLLVLIFLTSCNGQTKTQSETTSVSIPKTTSIGQPKLIKTQGSKIGDEVRCALQDKAGNLWFGTTGEGVYRYDGKLFIQYTIKAGLSSNTVWSVLEDKTGNIWFGTTDGLCRYDGKNIIPVPISGNFIPTESSNDYYTDWSKKNTVWSMLQDRSGRIWYGTGDGVYCYDGSTFTRFLDNFTLINKDGLHLKMVDCILEDKNGNIWFASGMPPGGEGVCLYDGKSITSYKPNGDGWIRNMIEDKNGNIWFSGRSHGNFIYDGKTFINFAEKVGIGNSILSDKAGNIWFTGEEGDNLESVGGIWRYDGNTFKNFTMKDGMGKYFVWCMIEDRKGNIWIGTRNTGLYRYDGETFTSFSE